MSKEEDKKMGRFKVYVNGGQHQFVDARNKYEAAKAASGESILKKVESEKAPPAGYEFTTYKNKNVTVKVVEG